jgi:hypothetical protein
MRRRDLFIGRLVPVGGQELAEQLVRAHADGTMNSRHLHVVAGLGEGLPPGHGVQVITIDQRAIDIEQHRADEIGHHADIPAPAAANPRRNGGTGSPIQGQHVPRCRRAKDPVALNAARLLIPMLRRLPARRAVAEPAVEADGGQPGQVCGPGGG